MSLLRCAAAIAGLLAAVSAGSCSRAAPAPTRESAVVTASWLECALADVCPGEFAVVRLAPPGSCPGHFDATPVQTASVRSASVVLCFDFQQGLEEKLVSASRAGATFLRVSPGDGMCVPETLVWTAFLVLAALTLAVNLAAVGGLMIFSLLANPAVAAARLARSYPAMLAWSASLGAASALFGFAVACTLGWPTGATIVLASGLLLASAFLSQRVPAS